MARTLRLDEETERLVAIAAASQRSTRHAYIVRAVRAQLLRDGQRDRGGPLAAALDKHGKD
jgi:hypothetical protein